ncbi:hypothetical protein ACO22_00582 [Paracoccidioides brasiliensis]|uniref:Uncharacterized protein n=1 Tax=Paracoccidioides brasiliensis TaxID=121759 RepID=A0A1D2JNW3_PARBR|nr:hypothetical protein ACO22_00582 [Paracoccidioides brasiliensis]
MRLLVLNKLLFRSCSNGKNRKDREKERGHCHPVGPSKGDQLTQRHDDIWKEWLGKRQPSWPCSCDSLARCIRIFEEGAVQESRTKEESCGRGAQLSSFATLDLDFR